MKHGAEYILLLNNDTIVEPDFLSELVECSKRYGDRAAIGAKIYYESCRDKIWYAGGRFNFRTSRSSHIGIDKIDKGQFDKLKEVSFVTGCCVLLHKNIIKQVGFIPENYFLYCEDLAYSIELLKAGIKLVYNPKAVIYHKVSASTGKNSKTSIYYCVRNKLYIIKRYINRSWRVFAHFVFLCENLKRIMQGKYDWKTVLLSYNDYFKGLEGEKAFQ